MIQTACPFNAIQTSCHHNHVARGISNQTMQLNVAMLPRYMGKYMHLMHCSLKYIFHNKHPCISINLWSYHPSFAESLHKVCHFCTSMPFLHHQTAKDKLHTSPVWDINWELKKSEFNVILMLKTHRFLPQCMKLLPRSNHQGTSRWRPDHLWPALTK